RPIRSINSMNRRCRDLPCHAERSEASQQDPSPAAQGDGMDALYPKTYPVMLSASEASQKDPSPAAQGDGGGFVHVDGGETCAG
ncbi:MAG: hypothetical protein SNJ72_06475, partial [Fimbriimonadales bacterium]